MRLSTKASFDSKRVMFPEPKLFMLVLVGKGISRDGMGMSRVLRDNVKLAN